MIHQQKSESEDVSPDSHGSVILLVLLVVSVNQNDRTVLLFHFDSAFKTDGRDGGKDDSPWCSRKAEDCPDDTDCHRQVQNNGIVFADTDKGNIAIFYQSLNVGLDCIGFCM